MGILALVRISDSAWKWIHRLGGPGLIVLGLADNTPFISAPPGSEDVFVILLSAHHPSSWVYYAFMATVGEVLGGFMTYRLAEKGGQATLERKMGKPRSEKIYRRFEKRGFATVFTGSLLPPPFPFTPVLMVAGVMQYPRKKLPVRAGGGACGAFFRRGLSSQDLWAANDRLLFAARPAVTVPVDLTGSDRQHRSLRLL